MRARTSPYPPPRSWREANLTALNAVFDSSQAIREFLVPGILPSDIQECMTRRNLFSVSNPCAAIDTVARAFGSVNETMPITSDFVFDASDTPLFHFASFYERLSLLLTVEDSPIPYGAGTAEAPPNDRPDTLPSSNASTTPPTQISDPTGLVLPAITFTTPDKQTLDPTALTTPPTAVNQFNPQFSSGSNTSSNLTHVTSASDESKVENFTASYANDFVQSAYLTLMPHLQRMAWYAESDSRCRLRQMYFPRISG
jgi:hypothetical protein